VLQQIGAKFVTRLLRFTELCPDLEVDSTDEVFVATGQTAYHKCPAFIPASIVIVKENIPRSAASSILIPRPSRFPGHIQEDALPQEEGILVGFET